MGWLSPAPGEWPRMARCDAPISPERPPRQFVRNIPCKAGWLKQLGSKRRAVAPHHGSESPVVRDRWAAALERAPPRRTCYPQGRFRGPPRRIRAIRRPCLVVHRRPLPRCCRGVATGAARCRSYCFPPHLLRLSAHGVRRLRIIDQWTARPPSRAPRAVGAGDRRVLPFSGAPRWTDNLSRHSQVAAGKSVTPRRCAA